MAGEQTAKGMSRNPGKVFEEQWKKSTPDYALLYRLPDPAQSFGGGNRLRFSRKPEFDFLLWDSQRHILYALELKSVRGKSISFERSEKEDREIHYNQITGLNRWNAYDGIVCGLIVEFRGIEKTVFLDIEQMNRIMELIPKKSFNYDDFDRYKIRYTLIQQNKVRTKYLYDVDGFLNNKENSEERNGEL